MRCSNGQAVHHPTRTDSPRNAPLASAVRLRRRGASEGTSPSIASASSLPSPRVVGPFTCEDGGRRPCHRSVTARRAFLARADLMMGVRVCVCVRGLRWYLLHREQQYCWCWILLLVLRRTGSLGPQQPLDSHRPTSGCPPAGPRPAGPVAPGEGRRAWGGASPAAARHPRPGRLPSTPGRPRPRPPGRRLWRRRRSAGRTARGAAVVYRVRVYFFLGGGVRVCGMCVHVCGGGVCDFE